MIIKNPYTSGNPIKSEQMFYGRKTELQSIEDGINTGQPVILLIGGRRAGKTSILHQIKNGKFKENAEIVWCDCHRLISKVYNDYEFIYEFGKAVLENTIFQPFAEEFINNLTPNTANHCLQILLKQCSNLIAPKKLLVLCDEFDSLEKLFETKILSTQALAWTATAFTLPLCFIMTCPRHYENHAIKEAFGHNVPTVTIAEFDKQDSFELIQKPCPELNYSQDALENIYRLSGGFPYYIQTICEELVNLVNTKLKHTYIETDNLEAVIEFILTHTPGHIDETLRFLIQSPETIHVIAALAKTIKNIDEYVDIQKILKTAKEKGFRINGINGFTQYIDNINKTTRLLEIKNNQYRFRTDILRQVICYQFYNGNQIESNVPEENILSKIKSMLTGWLNYLTNIDDK